MELGLQTASDEIAATINRGYKTEVYRRAADILRSHGIPFVAHMIIGLPGETDGDIDATVELINERAWGVKIHSIYVMEGTELANLYYQKRYTPPSLEEYTVAAAYAVARMPADTVIHRLTGDCPRDMLIAPDWNRDKNEIIRAVTNELTRSGLKQGSLN